MTPSDIVTLTTCILASMLAVALSYWIAGRRASRREQTATAIANARRAGFIQGMDHGFAVWGVHVKRVHGLQVHGFAEACRGCKTINGMIMAVGSEYWNCPECKHRNPAPMPAGSRRAAVAKEVPHES